MKYFVILFALLVVVKAHACLKLTFTPSDAQFKEDASTYTNIWNENCVKVIESMERISGLKFQEREIKATIYEGISLSGKDNIPMKLRASYKPETKKATLIHELGHRILMDVPTTSEITEHKKLFLILYDIWVDLYGEQFANDQVQIEKQRKGVYPEAWDWALAMNKTKRAEIFTKLKQSAH